MRLTSVWRGTFFRIGIFLWVIVCEPIFGCSTELGNRSRLDVLLKD